MRRPNLFGHPAAKTPSSSPGRQSTNPPAPKHQLDSAQQNVNKHE